MNTKIGIFVMLLILSGVFATTLVLAEDEVSVEETDTSEIAVGKIDAGEVSEVLEEIEEEEMPMLKRIGLVNTWSGHGWIENGEDGHLITGLWAIQKFVDTGNSEISTQNAWRTFGRLHISGNGMYKLVRYKDETSEDNVNFHVVPLMRVVTVDNAEDYAVGTLALNRVNVYNRLTTWSGSLVFDSGDLSGEWNVDLGTINRKVKPRALMSGGGSKGVGVSTPGNVVQSTRQQALDNAGVETLGELDAEQRAELKGEIKQIVKQSFWRRLQFWRRD